MKLYKIVPFMQIFKFLSSIHEWLEDYRNLGSLLVKDVRNLTI